MSKSAPAVEAVETSVEITLTEFCTRLSETLRRPELIGAFEFVERNAGRVKATQEAFKSRFDKFINSPA